MIASMTPDRALKLAVDQLADVQLTDNTMLEARQARIELTGIITRLCAELTRLHGEEMTALKDKMESHHE